MDVINISVSNGGILIISVLLLASVLYGASTDDFLLLKLLLYVGMFFSWILYFNGLIATIATDYYISLQRHYGLQKHVTRLLLLALALGAFLILSALAGIEII